MNKNILFEKLVAAYSKDLYRFGYWLAKDPNVAEDLVQETFSRAWKNLESLRDEKAAKAWLLTILRRENARRFEKFQPELLEINDEILLDDSGGDSGDLMDKDLLYEAILKMPEEFKEPLMLQIKWGYSGREIGEQLNLKLATVNTRLFRARQYLKQVFQTDSLQQKIGGR